MIFKTTGESFPVWYCFMKVKSEPIRDLLSAYENSADCSIEFIEEFLNKIYKLPENFEKKWILFAAESISINKDLQRLNYNIKNLKHE